MRLRGSLKLSVAACIALPIYGHAQDTTLPQDGTVASGNVAISQPGAGKMVLDQGSNQAIVDWGSFSIGKDAHVDIRQPGTQSAILNRVTGDTTSAIHGQLTANGSVYLVNPNGIYIGPNGSVNAGSFSASTLDIKNEDFLAGKLKFEGKGNSATVENAGRITIGRGGYAALIGGKVRNSGTVFVPFGRIGLAAGEWVTLDVSGDQFLQVAVPSDNDDEDALIDNSGTVRAEGGLIEMRAATARHAARHAINLSGVAEASSVSVRGGTIVLGGGAGGKVTVSGRATARSTPRANIVVDASPRPVRRGGEVEITGQSIALAGADIDASGPDGGGLIRIGGDFAGLGALQRAETLFADAETIIVADALNNGDGGRVALWSDVQTSFNGDISARGGQETGNGGFVEVSSKKTLSYRGFTDTRAPNGLWGNLLLDPDNIFIDPGAGGEDALETSLAASNVTLNTASDGSDAGVIAINADIDWTAATDLTLIANDDINFDGSIDAPNGGLILDATNDIVVSEGINIEVLNLTATSDEFNLLGTVIETGSDGVVDVGRFRTSGGTWRQVNSSLSSFSADDFEVGFGDSFLRALGGDGSSGDPFQITDVFGLQGMNFSGGTEFQLANNIDASSTDDWSHSDGEGFRPLSNATGVFDGNGFTISGLAVRPTAEGSPVDAAMFETIGGSATVENLEISNAAVEGNDAAVLAVTNSGTISNVRVSGTVDANGNRAGGMVATNNGTINDSSANVAVTLDNTDGFSGGSEFQAGGFVGRNLGTINRSNATGNVTLENDRSADLTVGGFAASEGAALTINDSFSTGNVTVNDATGSGATISAGGFIGVILGAVNRSFSTGAVSVSSDSAPSVGGFAGAVAGSSNGNFWDVTSSGQATSPGATGLTTAQFQNTQAFLALGQDAGWNFSTVWAPGDTGFYPAHFSTSAVFFVTPDDLTVQYGQTGSTSATGSTSGGPTLFAFGPSGDTINTGPIFAALTFSSQDVGARTYTLNATTADSAGGVTYRIISGQGNAQITPAPLTITANDIVKNVGQTLTFGGTEFATSGLVFDDSVNSVSLFSLGAPEGAEAGSYTIEASNAVGSGLSNYNITFVNGSLTVGDPDGDVIPRPPPFIGVDLPNPTDVIDTGSDDSARIASTTGGNGSLAAAEETLAEVEALSSALELAADSCGESSGDVSRYLACLSESLSEFADELDELSADLPPSMQNVARIVQDARVRVDQARTRAQGRLANATTDAEREAIRREAISEAATALADAATEIRKSIALVRADDPELATVQRATVTTVANAVDNVGIKLSRSVGL